MQKDFGHCIGCGALDYLNQRRPFTFLNACQRSPSGHLHANRVDTSQENTLVCYSSYRESSVRGDPVITSPSIAFLHALAAGRPPNHFYVHVGEVDGSPTRPDGLLPNPIDRDESEEGSAHPSAVTQFLVAGQVSLGRSTQPVCWFCVAVCFASCRRRQMGADVAAQMVAGIREVCHRCRRRKQRLT